jgi:hypothetical protein
VPDDGFVRPKYVAEDAILNEILLIVNAIK